MHKQATSLSVMRDETFLKKTFNQRLRRRYVSRWSVTTHWTDKYYNVQFNYELNVFFWSTVITFEDILLLLLLLILLSINFIIV